MTRRLNLWLLLVLIFTAIPYYWYLVDPSVGLAAADPATKPVTMRQLRALAAAPEGPRPAELRVETVGMRFNSRNMLAAGSGLRTMPNTIRSYQLTIPGSRSIVIDAGVSAQAAVALTLDQFDARAQRRVDRARARAGHRLVLSDRPVHNGGHAPGPAISPADMAPHALAPGIVVIPVGLPHDTVMIYARMANGREYLFTGDVAKLYTSWAQLRPPARFATRDDPAPSRAENLSWLMTINALHRAAPRMVIVAGHDPAEVPFSAGTFSD